jgi:hypothetical protein
VDKEPLALGSQGQKDQSETIAKWLKASRSKLLARQSRNGGWAFGADQIGVEPTCLSVLALLGTSRHLAEPALRFLRMHQNADGSWPAVTGDEPLGCWTTSLALLTLLAAGD